MRDDVKKLGAAFRKILDRVESPEVSAGISKFLRDTEKHAWIDNLYKCFLLNLLFDRLADESRSLLMVGANAMDDSIYAEIKSEFIVTVVSSLLYPDDLYTLPATFGRFEELYERHMGQTLIGSLMGLTIRLGLFLSKLEEWVVAALNDKELPFGSCLDLDEENQFKLSAVIEASLNEKNISLAAYLDFDNANQLYSLLTNPVLEQEFIVASTPRPNLVLMLSLLSIRLSMPTLNSMAGVFVQLKFKNMTGETMRITKSLKSSASKLIACLDDRARAKDFLCKLNRTCRHLRSRFLVFDLPEKYKLSTETTKTTINSNNALMNKRGS